jgi:hypothetical protein
LQSRYYSPEWGRFINADAIAAVTGELLSENMFAYCKNNVVNMHDDTGFRPAFDSEEAEEAYNQWLQEKQEELEEANATDRLRARDAKKREKRDVNTAWGPRGSRERETASTEAHGAKRREGKGNDENFGWKDLKGKNFNKMEIGMSTRIALGIGGTLVIGGTIAEDFLTGGAGIVDDGVTISGGFGMIIKAFAY